MASVTSKCEFQLRINAYLNLFCNAVSHEDSSTLSRLISLSSNSPSLLSLADALNLFQDGTNLIKQSDKFSEYREILTHLLSSLQSYRLGNFVKTYLSFENFASSFVKEFRKWKSAWGLKALYVVCYEIRLLAEKADQELSSNGKSPDKLKAAGSFLTKVFGLLAVKGPKRVGALYVACQLFRTYFKLGTFDLCQSIIRSIETSRLFDFEEFPISDKVTYMYFTGRLEVLNENFTAANTKLSYAYLYCNPNRKQMIRMILKYLIPVKFSIGMIPSDELLHKHNLREYKKITQALRKGDIRLLRQALQKHEDRFLKAGVYLVLEKLELQVYRRLMKKIYIKQQKKKSDTAKAHQIKLEVIVKELKSAKIEMDVEEVGCIVTILKHKKLMKGYLAHKSKVVVLSKQDPFPKPVSEL